VANPETELSTDTIQEQFAEPFDPSGHGFVASQITVERLDSGQLAV
jgi:hypothetical protein